MLNCNYSRIIIIGYGYITGEVLKHVQSLSGMFGYNCCYIEHEQSDFNTIHSYCENEGIEHRSIPDKTELAAYFEALRENTLIVSASNNYLFPSSVLDKKNITAINFHNALLPDFPGRNAPSWAIYEGRDKTGITWHYVTSDVDAGNIIIQKETEITRDVKAYELAGTLMHLAFDAFKECFASVLTGTAVCTAQPDTMGRHMYRSTEVPGNAFFNADDDPEKIYSLLRAIDYGKSGIFPPAHTFIGQSEATVLRYKAVDKEKSKEGNEFLNYTLNDGRILQIKIRLC